jgi:hypothetical protein
MKEFPFSQYHIAKWGQKYFFLPNLATNETILFDEADRRLYRAK